MPSRSLITYPPSPLRQSLIAFYYPRQTIDQLGYLRSPIPITHRHLLPHRLVTYGANLQGACGKNMEFGDSTRARVTSESQLCSKWNTFEGFQMISPWKAVVSQSRMREDLEAYGDAASWLILSGSSLLSLSLSVFLSSA